MHIAKKGLRVLGIAESYSGREQSTLAGVVMRRDLRVDGVAFSRVTVGGTDATESVIGMVAGLERRDINLLMISGCVIAWYNIIDPVAVRDATGLPVIIVTYEESEGLEQDIADRFPGDAERLAAYRMLGDRTPFRLSTDLEIYLRPYGIPFNDAARLADAFTFEGRIPEPLRLARLVARGVVRSSLCGSSSPHNQHGRR
jgi:uncharacterized protein